MVRNMAVQRQSWHLNDAGILRKKEEDDELLVFGYSCKIFRDDEKALFIDQGKHLIPWMGDESLKIDRYDGRAALADLRESEAPLGGYDLWASLSDSERRVEQLCDEERYRALTHNEEEEALYQGFRSEVQMLKRLSVAAALYGTCSSDVSDPMQGPSSGMKSSSLKMDPESNSKRQNYMCRKMQQQPKEEELKRLQQALSAENTYGQVAYQYDETGQPVGEQKPEGLGSGGATAEEDEPFVAPQELDIPLNMVLPETVKANAIIEKTAMFINEQGAQMEILLKMKQARNPQFQFLSFDDPLHSYYRHLLMAIKTGRYRPKPPKEEEEDEGDQDEEDDGYYLHPSLASSASRIELAPSIPSINYKPSADCAYSMLVNKIRDKQAAFVAEETVAAASVTPIVAVPLASANAQSDQDSAEEEDVEEEEAEQAAFPSYKGGKDDVIRASKGESMNPSLIIGIGRKRRKRRGARRKRRSSGGMEKGDFGGMTMTPQLEPPPEMQIVIDKMASYVAKNGRDFETIVKSKGDPRFAFLEASHQFNSYYRLRLQEYELQNAPTIAVQETLVPSPAKKQKKGPEKIQTDCKSGNLSKSPERAKGLNQDKETSKSSMKLAPVCFSIKKPKEVEILPLEKRSALLLEETSEEEEGEEDSEGKVEQPAEEIENKAKLRQMVAERLEQSQPFPEAAHEKEDVRIAQDVPHILEVKKEEIITANVINDNPESILVENDAIKVEDQDALSSVVTQSNVAHEDQTALHAVDDVEVEKDMFLELGEANSPGGLSPASAANRERHLQQERKRKAAIFLRMIKKEHPPDAPSKLTQAQESDTVTKPEAPIETIIVEDDDSYSSIPSPPIISLSKMNLPSPPSVRKDEWSFPSPASGGQNGISSYSSRDKLHRKMYPSESDGRDTSPCHRRHHHHHRGHKHKHRKEIISPTSPSSAHKRARSRSRSRSKTTSDRPRKEGSSLSKHKKGKKKKARSRSRSRTRRHSSSTQGHHHHKKSKHHSHHKGKKREKDEIDTIEEHPRRHRSRSRERKYTEKRRKTPENVAEGLSSKGDNKKKRDESSGGSSDDRSSGSESSDSRDSAR